MITYHKDLIQGTDEWIKLRCGILTASEMDLIITPKQLKFSTGEKMRTHLYELAAQRVNNFVELSYISEDMLKGMENEEIARDLYNWNYSPVETCGFITNSSFGFTIGYSPDGIVGDDGLIEIKSRRQKYQFETICADEVPIDYVLQLQTGLLVSGRKWVDFISYNAGMPMFVKRVLPDEKIQSAILEAATEFHNQLGETVKKYADNVERLKLIKTERTEKKEEITV